ncbi:telomere repeats-binding bouquet formation protein 1-like [Ornithorhynchus anatinus]|uniref:telomere repeats-binding bouquet formation protein 1-like n=1 Tax=Ornithorhynchus anatinus TaxID=9258 RepID=UPI0019D49AF0|nr:telomere repeats-binding bouquet formation protein 1-like [Ornithorhynchus anatinus]
MEDKKSEELTCAEKDIDLLLECIKQPLNSLNTDALKSALLSVVSICEKYSSAGVYFHHVGGLELVYNLARSDVPSILKEIALYALGTLANSNVLCQQSLCTPELFDDIATIIGDEKSSMDLQTISVSLLFGLISKNRAGQTLLRERGCIPVLLKLFRETLSKSEIDSLNESFKEKCFLWYVVCSTLAAAVDNPKNEENQKACFSILPHVQSLLAASMKPEIIRPLCLIIGLTVEGNSLVQEFFISIDGLDVLSDVLTKLVADSCENISSAKMAVDVTTVMGTCIDHNRPGGRILAKHQVVPKLLTLLFVEGLTTEEKTSVLVTLGRCIQTCDENLSLLFQNNGLKLIEDSFSSSNDEIVSSIVAFIQFKLMIWVEKLKVKILASVSKWISKTKKRRKAPGHLKKTKETLTEASFKGEDEEQGPKTDGVAGDSLLKGNDQEKALPKQCFELGAQIYHPPANDELKSQLESPGGDPASTRFSEREPVGSEPVFEHPAPAVENGAQQATKGSECVFDHAAAEDGNRAQQPPKEEQPENP